MGYSDADYRGLSFTANDVFLAVVLSHVVAAIDRLADRPAWLDELREDWQMQATGGFGFGIVPNLDKFVTEEGRRATMIALFRRALDDIEGYGEVITAEQLDELQAAGPNAVFAGDLPTEHFMQVGRRFIDLLEGRIPKP